jgi:hypothetical protein
MAVGNAGEPSCEAYLAARVELKEGAEVVDGIPQPPILLIAVEGRDLLTRQMGVDDEVERYARVYH